MEQFTLSLALKMLIVKCKHVNLTCVFIRIRVNETLRAFSKTNYAISLTSLKKDLTSKFKFEINLQQEISSSRKYKMTLW